MNKRIKYLLVLVLSVFITANVNALECYYTYYSDELNDTSVKVTIEGEKATSEIILMNGEKVTNKENWVKGWSYSEFTAHKNVCPYYVLAESSGNATVRVGYDYDKIKKVHDGIWDKKEAHICISTTIEADKAKNNDEYDESTDNHEGDDSDINHHSNKTIAKTCNYNTNVSKEGEKNYSAGVLQIYTDGTYSAYMTKMRGTDQGVWTHDHFKQKEIKFKDDESKQRIANKECPFYMYADYNWNNKVGFSKTGGTSSGQLQWMVSDSIAEDKEDYDEEKDGRGKDVEDSDKKTESEFNEHSDSILNPLDQDDPFNGEHIGEDICHDENVVKALKALGVFIIIAKFAIPMIIIIMGTVDFVNVVMSGDSKDLGKKAKSLGLRVVIGLGIMFAPTLVNAFLNGLTYYQVMSEEARACQSCLLDPYNPENCSTTKLSSDPSVDGTPERNYVKSGELGDRVDEEKSNIGEIDKNRVDKDKSNIGDINNKQDNGVNTSESNNGNTVKTTQTAQGNTVKVTSSKNTSRVAVEDPDLTKKANIN